MGQWDCVLVDQWGCVAMGQWDCASTGQQDHASMDLDIDKCKVKDGYIRCCTVIELNVWLLEHLGEGHQP